MGTFRGVMAHGKAIWVSMRDFMIYCAGESCELVA